MNGDQHHIHSKEGRNETCTHAGGPCRQSRDWEQLLHRCLSAASSACCHRGALHSACDCRGWAARTASASVARDRSQRRPRAEQPQLIVLCAAGTAPWHSQPPLLGHARSKRLRRCPARRRAARGWWRAARPAWPPPAVHGQIGSSWCARVNTGSPRLQNGGCTGASPALHTAHAHGPRGCREAVHEKPDKGRAYLQRLDGLPLHFVNGAIRALHGGWGWGGWGGVGWGGVGWVWGWVGWVGGQEDGQTVGEAKVGKVRGPLNGRWRHCAAAYCQQGGRHCTRPSGSWQAGRFKASIRPVACAQSTTAGGQPPKLHIWCHLHVCSRYNQAGANKESTPATHVVLRLDHRLGVRRQALVPAGHLLDVGNRLACT